MHQSTLAPSAKHAASAATQLKVTLTNNPQDVTEIPSLFQTFGQNDVSSGEDDDVETLEVNPANDYAVGPFGHATATAVSGGRGSGGAASATRASGAAAGPYPAAAAHSSAMRASTTNTTSLNASRNRHPLNRSTHNPYVLLSSTDGTTWNGPDVSTSFPTASSSMTGRPVHRYSFSNSTSQNPLTFEFNSSATGGEPNVNSNSPSTNVGMGGGSRRQPSQLLHSLQSQQGVPPPQQQQQQQHPTSEQADGFWRNGNPTSMSSTDVRPVTTTTVGTLSAVTTGELQTINVNVRQRVRASTSSRASSLSTSQITMPIVQPASSSAGASAGGNAGPLPLSNGTNPPGDSSPLSHATNGSVRRGSSSGSNSAERRTVPQQSGTGGPLRATSGSSNSNISSSRNRMINVPASAMMTSDDGDNPSNPSATDDYNSNSPPQQQQQQQFYRPHALPVPPPPQPQQPYYGYGGPNMAPPHSPYSQSPVVYAGQPAYPGVPQPPSGYSSTKVMPYPPQVPPQSPLTPQQQQYYDTQAMMQGQASVGGYINPYGHFAPSPNYYMNPAAAGGPAMMHGYGYPAAMPSVHPYTHAMPPAVYGCEPRHRRGGRGRHQQQQQQQQQSPPSVSPTAAGDPPAPSPALQQTNPAPGKPKNAKGKLQNVSDNKSQSRQAGMKKSTSAGVASSALQTDGKATARNESAGCTTPMPSVTARGTKELAKEHDEARFHANRTAPIQLFVVVKRRMEGQRYACPLPPEEVPVGSRMLVEGDRGADLGEVLAHVSVEQMARDCAVVERRRKAALEKMRVQKSSGAAAITAAAALSREENSGAEAACDEAGLPQLTRQEALNYVLSLRDWPWLIGPATIQDVESLGPQREAEKQAFATAKTIVQQFIENRYQQRVARNEQALHAAASPDAAEHKEEEEKAEENASVAAAANEKHAEDASSDDGERRTSLIPLTAEELQTLELSRQVTLVDCEYQFTREKITLFVSRPSRNIFVDFRRMQRKLYRTFRCRIWIAYMDEIADDEDAPESFVFVPPPSSSTAATGTLPGATEDDRQKDA